MKTILYTGWDAPYRPLADLTVPRMLEYARRHGYGLHTFEVPPPGLNIYWTGVARGLQLLKEKVDRAIYLDVDQMITNQRWSIDDNMTHFKHGFHVPRDWGKDASTLDCSACCLILHQDCIPLLEEILALEPEFRDKPFQEQAPMRQVLMQRLGTHQIFVHARKPYNCVPDPWKPADFAAHLTMLPLAERVALAQKIAKMSC